MKDINDKDFGQNTITLRDNRVATSIIPRTNAELDRQVIVDTNVLVEGSTYAKFLEISNGPAEFKKAVFADKELHIKSDAKDLIYFNKSVASSQSVSSLISTGRAIYGGDVNAPTIKMKNCMVCGSIYGTEIQLENCVVLGGVFSSRSLTINGSIIGTFNSPEVNASGVNYLLYPTAFSVEPMSLLPNTEFWNLSLADLGSLYKGEDEKQNTGKIKIDLVNDTQRTVLTDENGTQSLINSYSVASRVLVSDLIDMEKMENHFLIISASLGSQILKTYSLTKSNGEKGPELNVKDITEFFFNVLSGKIQVREIDGKLSFDELKKNYE
ncbi:hypothetical protein [Treponema sp.]|uniref:hypothetical protein n=1 Tax=Treponema sp. TaxID=166 RepID=UPI0025D6BF4A|nr:hypothetical protein [Treponema sp.]MBR4322381.1 hypothetical protein [Treponema sp.]